MSDAHLKQLENRIRSINPTAEMYRTERSGIPLQHVLNIHAFDGTQPSVRFVAEENYRHADSALHHDHFHAEGPHLHDNEVTCENFVFTGDFDLEKLETFLGSMLWSGIYTHEEDHENKTQEESNNNSHFQGSRDIFRMKALLSIKGSKKKHSLQAVHTLFEVTETLEDWESEDGRINKIVVIGRNLQQAELQRGFMAALTSRLPETPTAARQ